jgi:glycosyltransferase involved in cell wall biosynthesis
MVLAVARLAHQKGLDVLLAAAPAWRGRVDHPLLVVAGDGPNQKDLHEQAASLAIDVRFLGRRNDIADLMRSADVVVLPSRWEGSPLTAQEALQSGTPLVATSVGGVPDLVQAPDGPAALLVPADDPSELAAGVARVLDDPDLRNELIKRGVQRAKAWPTSQQTINKVLAVYSELLGAAE